MELDPLLLSRVQFAVAISFHILFPAFTIGLAAWLVVLEARWYATGRALYLELSEFWIRIFAVSFGMGVVSGVVMSFQFGTNWSRLSERAGNVLGPLLNYEVVTAFFLEATFLGILLFGRRRVPPWLHFLAACMVALGTLVSAFWILSANSWMQTPDRPRAARRHVLRDQLVGGGVQPVLPLPPRAHGDRGVPDHRLRRRRRQRLAPARGPHRAACADRLLDGAGPDHGAGAAADPARRPARAQHVRAPAGQGRRAWRATGSRSGARR